MSTTSVVRVSMSHLDELLNATGEILISGGQLKMLKETIEDLAMRQAAPDRHLLELARQLTQSQEGNSTKLQDLVMEMRQVEIRDSVQRAKLTVRDLAKKTGREVQLVTTGEETLVDRAIVEKLSDPLMHLLRNAVDHGIELPEEREQAGKPPVGTVSLKVSKSAQNIIIEITDDGKGLDVEVIKRKGVERGLISEAAAATISPEEVYNLIFESGFSTAAKVTDISGRGVGMDVVRRNIEVLGGEIQIESEKGRGTTFKIIFPNLSAVNIIDALLVKAGGETFAIPMDKVEATVRLNVGELKSVHGQPAWLFRNQTLPLFDLGVLIGLRFREDRESGFGDASTDRHEVVVVGDRKDRLALKVDRLLTPQKIVSTALDKLFSNVRGISGTTAFGVGKMGMILDVPALIQMQKGEPDSRSPSRPEAAVARAADRLSAVGGPQDTGADTPKDAVGNIETELRVVMQSEVPQEELFGLAPALEGRLVDAVAKGEKVYQVDIFMDKDLRVGGHQLSQLLAAAESVADVVAVSPFAAALPDLESFQPESFDLRVAFYLITRKPVKDIASAIGLAEERFKDVGVEIHEQKITRPEVGSAAPAVSAEPPTTLQASMVDLEDYVLDMKDHLSAINDCALKISEGAEFSGEVERMFRAVHSMKGSSALMGLTQMAAVAHKVEDVMDAVRNGKIEATEKIVDLVLDMSRMFESSLEEISRGQVPVLARADALMSLALDLLPAKAAVAVLESGELEPTGYDKLVMNEYREAGRDIYEVGITFASTVPMKMVAALMLFQSIKQVGDVITTAPSMAAIDRGQFDLSFKMLFSTADRAWLEKKLKDQELENFEIKDWKEI